jgi:endo-1,3(4)-beta-glucanase
MGRLDPSFLDTFGPNVDAIFHDVAHPLNSDSSKVQPSNLFFPLARHKSWFDGHSFATGLFPFANGKSQESSSEAVNCYYGAYLWSLVRHGGSNAGSDLTDFTRLLLAMEIRSTKAYWHMIPPTTTNASNASEIYAPEFQENYMVGNVGMLDVEASTWFGGEPLYVHMFNALPITAITAKLFDRDYVQYEYPFLMKSSDSVEMAWRGYTVSIHAIIDPATAWKEARELVSWELDSGLSKSQVLYWICQRPGFTNSTIDVDEDVSAIVPFNN